MRGWAEIAAVVATGVVHLLVSEVLQLQGPFIAAALAGWGGYAYVRVRRRLAQWAEWGFRSTHLKVVCLASAAFAVPAAIAMAAVAHARNALPLPGHVVWLFLLYPLWGLVQQYLVLALVARNLLAGGLPKPAIVLVSGVLFGVVHLPDLQLSSATLLVGLVFAPIYLRWRNLWPLGVLHGWLGVLFYYWILGRDPWLELMG